MHRQHGQLLCAAGRRGDLPARRSVRGAELLPLLGGGAEQPGPGGMDRVRHDPRGRAAVGPRLAEPAGGRAQARGGGPSERGPAHQDEPRADQHGGPVSRRPLAAADPAGGVADTGRDVRRRGGGVSRLPAAGVHGAVGGGLHPALGGGGVVRDALPDRPGRAVGEVRGAVLPRGLALQPDAARQGLEGDGDEAPQLCPLGDGPLSEQPALGDGGAGLMAKSLSVAGRPGGAGGFPFPATEVTHAGGDSGSDDQGGQDDGGRHGRRRQAGADRRRGGAEAPGDGHPPHRGPGDGGARPGRPGAGLCQGQRLRPALLRDGLPDGEEGLSEARARLRTCCCRSRASPVLLLKKFLVAVFLMASFANGTSAASTSDNSSLTTGSFTPGAGDLLLAPAVVTGQAGGGTFSDSQGLGWTQVNSALKNASADTIVLAVANRFAAGSAMTVTFTPAGAPTCSGQAISVVRIIGMSRAGSAAIRQSGVQNNGAAGTGPIVTWGKTSLPRNLCYAVVGSGTSPAPTLPPLVEPREAPDEVLGNVHFDQRSQGQAILLRALRQAPASVAPRAVLTVVPRDHAPTMNDRGRAFVLGRQGANPPGPGNGPRPPAAAAAAEPATVFLEAVRPVQLHGKVAPAAAAPATPTPVRVGLPEDVAGWQRTGEVRLLGGKAGAAVTPPTLRSALAVPAEDVLSGQRHPEALRQGGLPSKPVTPPTLRPATAVPAEDAVTPQVPPRSGVLGGKPSAPVTPPMHRPARFVPAEDVLSGQRHTEGLIYGGKPGKAVTPPTLRVIVSGWPPPPPEQLAPPPGAVHGGKPTAGVTPPVHRPVLTWRQDAGSEFRSVPHDGMTAAVIHAFPPTLVHGPLCVTAAGVNVPGPTAATLIVTGLTAANVSVPGPTAATLIVTGLTAANVSVPGPTAATLIAAGLTADDVSVPEPTAAALIAAGLTAANVSFPGPTAASVIVVGLTAANVSVPGPTAASAGLP